MEEAPSRLIYSGPSKVEFCQRLGASWSALADSLDIPSYAQTRFERGLEGRAIWAWLEERGELRRLPATLRAIGRQDLLEALVERERETFAHYWQERLDWWRRRFALDRRFVRLTLLMDQGEDTQGPRWVAQQRTFQDLREVLSAASAYPALVLLGPPGCGKSTLLRHVELDCAQQALAESSSAPSAIPLTFFIELSLYKPAPGKPLPVPREWLTERWRERFPNMPEFDTVLREQAMILLLDALNEMPHQGSEHIEAWRDFSALLAMERPRTRVIFSCRTQDYGARLSTKSLPVPQIHIERLSDQQVEQFLRSYQPDQAESLWKALRSNPRQLDLFRSPYYLTMLVQQVGPEAEIPRGRAVLFSRFVRQALNREIDGDNLLFKPTGLMTEQDCERMARHGCVGVDLPCEGPLFPKLSHLAYAMQETRRRADGAQIRIARSEALQVLGENHEMRVSDRLSIVIRRLAGWHKARLADGQQAEKILRAGLDLGVLDQDKRERQVYFYHQLLQEYFAARRLALRPNPRLVATAWQASKMRPRLDEVLKTLPDSEPLPLGDSTGWEETTLLAAAMVSDADAFVSALLRVNLPLAGRCAAQPDVVIRDALRHELQQALVARTGDPKADVRARIAAGLALGELGDPRFERRQGPHSAYLWPPLIEIRGGSYPIGSDEGLDEDEAPVPPVAVGTFWMGKFPVTNAEWSFFMQAGGYEQGRWWVTEEDKAWRRGERTAEGLKQDLRELREQLRQDPERIRAFHQQGRMTSSQADAWEQIAEMEDDEFERMLEGWYPPGRKTEPHFWNDEFFNNPDQPVVGISWFEARAYCAWLSAQTGDSFRLPTEAEWEAAARGGEGRRYAYGPKFDTSRCNTFESHIRRTTPIGVFPGGNTPDGLVDMTGNVWEWTSSLHKPYPYVESDGRENPLTGDVRRVVRGGSWHSSRGSARAAYRLLDYPVGRSLGQGFRVVCTSPNG